MGSDSLGGVKRVLEEGQEVTPEQLWRMGYLHEGEGKYVFPPTTQVIEVVDGRVREIFYPTGREVDL